MTKDLPGLQWAIEMGEAMAAQIWPTLEQVREFEDTYGKPPIKVVLEAARLYLQPAKPAEILPNGNNQPENGEKSPNLTEREEKPADAPIKKYFFRDFNNRECFIDPREIVGYSPADRGSCYLLTKSGHKLEHAGSEKWAREQCKRLINAGQPADAGAHGLGCTCNTCNMGV